MKLRDILVRVIDRCYREPRMSLRLQREQGGALWVPTSGECANIFMVDGRIPHGGMFDRLKGLITIYAISKAQGRVFRLCWTYPFDLQTYLAPNTYDWRCDAQQLNKGFFSHKDIIAYGEYPHPQRLWKRRRRETHFYYGYNSLALVNAHFGTQYEWGTLYRELFKPTQYLQQYLDRYREEVGNDYIAVHTRFLNLLGDKTETAINPELDTDAAKTNLMESALKAIQTLAATHADKRVLIASDSMRFIARVQQAMPEVYIVPGEVKHIDTAGATADAENIKMFTDYYLMSGAKKVYSLWHEGMWKSAFPEYAAMIGGIPFERIAF